MMNLLLFALISAEPGMSGALLQEPPPSQVLDTVDWSQAGDEAAGLLSEYLRVDTFNPPGNETRGAEFLAAVLASQGIPSSISEYAPGRGSLMARLPGNGQEPPLCLLSHIDVVPAESGGWPAHKGPLSGTIDDEGLIWGRGALDMKSMGAIETMTMLLAAREKIPLKRDLVLLAVADEEVSNAGMKHIIREHWDQIGCSHVINEGGLGIRDLFFEDQTFYAISVGEKGVLWVRMIASGEPGHGSTPIPGQATERLIAAVNKLQKRRARPHFLPSMLESLRQAGIHHGGIPGAVLRSPALVRLLLRGRLMADPLTRAAVTNTVNVTGFGGAAEPNVVGGEAWANLDCRLLPGTRPQDMLDELKATVDDPNVRFQVIQSHEAAQSPRDDPLYQALARNVVQGQPRAVAGPVISVGFTDSILLRPLGVHAYGLEPFAVTREEAATMHGNDERISTANITRGLQVLYRTVLDVAADPKGQWLPPKGVPASPPPAHERAATPATPEGADTPATPEGADTPEGAATPATPEAADTPATPEGADTPSPPPASSGAEQPQEPSPREQ